MQDLSPDMIEAIFAEDVEPTALLITLDSAGLDEPLRASSDPEGTVSRGESYTYYPFAFAFGGASQDEPARGAKLEIGNVDAIIAQTVRSLPAGAQVSVSCELIRTAAPDDVELAMTGARVSDIEIQDPTVSATIAPRAFNEEPACQARCVAARLPGLF